ncbi:CAP-Gly domain-containing linker protein 2 [Manis javanica]|nr:CAP-Gly domain-containing linker protein 2 [Manis javanica]
MSTEDALRDALDQAQQVEKLMEAMRSCPDKAQRQSAIPDLQAASTSKTKPRNKRRLSEKRETARLLRWIEGPRAGIPGSMKRVVNTAKQFVQVRQLQWLPTQAELSADAS